MVHGSDLQSWRSPERVLHNRAFGDLGFKLRASSRFSKTLVDPSIKSGCKNCLLLRLTLIWRINGKLFLPDMCLAAGSPSIHYPWEQSGRLFRHRNKLWRKHETACRVLPS
jgi:hypothetical protein